MASLLGLTWCGIDLLRLSLHTQCPQQCGFRTEGLLRGFSANLVKALRPVFWEKLGWLPLVKMKVSLHCHHVTAGENSK